MASSIEAVVQNQCREWLGKGNYKESTEVLTPDVRQALDTAFSKSGGKGKNFPDLQCMVQDVNGHDIPVMIECKGTKGDLVKLDARGEVANMTDTYEPDYVNRKKYAVNGALHYAEAILQYSEGKYLEALAVGVNGYMLGEQVHYELKVYYLSTKNKYIPKEIVGFGADLTILSPSYKPQLLACLKTLQFTPAELAKKKETIEDNIEGKLQVINQTMHDEMSIDVGNRVQLLAGMVMAGLGVKNQNIPPLSINALNNDSNRSDGQKVLDAITLSLQKSNVPPAKITSIIGVLSSVFTNVTLNVLQVDKQETKIHTLYSQVKQNIVPFLDEELYNIDFMGRLYNTINSWVKVPDGGQNNVVLTPRIVTELMVKLCEVNMNSYVWDYAMGSGGFLISAMNTMITDVQQSNMGMDEKKQKENHIKMYQLLGIEILSQVYILAVLNMILMKDGKANLIEGDSLKNYDGTYEQGDYAGQPFPADVFLLNPPYSEDGKGLNFVYKALSKMHKGKAAVIIQENAGSSQGKGYSKAILEHNTLLASIHMPNDLFIGKASVQTAIYVFAVGHEHKPENIVKFIDFSNDGYTRAAKKKTTQKNNLKDTGDAKGRYTELVNVVLHGKEYLNYYKDCYIEDTISLNGDDWTYNQHKKIDTKPTVADFKKVVKEYLAWRVGEVIKQEDSLGK